MTIEWNSYPKIDWNYSPLRLVKNELRRAFDVASQETEHTQEGDKLPHYPPKWELPKPSHMGITGFAQGGFTSMYRPTFFGDVAKELGFEGDEFTPEKALIYSRYGLIKWGCDLDEDNLECIRIALKDERSNEAIYKLSFEERMNPDILAETLLQIYRDILREF